MTPDQPAVSVVVPLYNEATSVRVLLGALNAQSFTPTEAVVVDAGSDDGTPTLVETFVSGFPIRLLRCGRLNPGQARNEGTRAAHHPWIAFADGGTEPQPGWLLALVEATADGAEVVFGSYEPLCDSYFRCCAALAYVPPRSATTGIRGPSVASMLIHRAAFEAAGRFPPHRASEDLVFLERIVEAGRRVAYAPGAMVRWQTATTPLATFRRFEHYSRANLEAGRGRFWHRGLARHYVTVAFLLAFGAFLGLGIELAPLLPIWFGARVLRAAWAKRRDLPFPTLRPDYLVGAAALLLLVDLATWVGGLRWLAERTYRLASNR